LILFRADGYIEKFGEDSWVKRRKSIDYKKSLEYFVEVFGFEEGLSNYNKLLKSFSFNKDQYIEKYGEDSWNKRWEKCNSSFYSEESARFFSILVKELDGSGIVIKDHRSGKNEFFLWDSEYRRIYFYDLYFEHSGKKIIIEYDNSFWHPKRGSMEKNAWNLLLKSGAMSLEEKIEYDERKKLWAIYKGYHLVEVYYSGKNALRNNELWSELIEESVSKIKKIIEC